RISIIAVHGLGGHWTRTWQAPDGAIWLRERIPRLFADTNVVCRVRSFGYNSAFAFTKGETDIAGCAKDLIDRISLMRRTDPEHVARPIIFVAHSLGGLVVKEALNIAWIRQSIYDDILANVKGCVFMGVPHHGAGIARWAKHATQILRIASLGFAGNANFLVTLEPKSPEWLRISSDFVERGKDISFRTFYETERTGNILVVDRASAAMHVPNEQVFAVPGSNHRTICQFSNLDNERFSLVGDAVLGLVQTSRKGNDASSRRERATIIPEV
ncbi:Alpha/Beta hydrolase protein, partial [Lasiosphaeria ovina]